MADWAKATLRSTRRTPPARLAWVLCFTSLTQLACGGSSSETPFPEPPLPDYLKPKPPVAVSAPVPAATAYAPPPVQADDVFLEAPSPPTWGGKAAPVSDFGAQQEAADREPLPPGNNVGDGEQDPAPPPERAPVPAPSPYIELE